MSFQDFIRQNGMTLLFIYILIMGGIYMTGVMLRTSSSPNEEMVIKIEGVENLEELPEGSIVQIVYDCIKTCNDEWTGYSYVELCYSQCEKLGRISCKGD